VTPSPAEVARLFDLLSGYFRYAVVDLSTRADALSRLICDLSQTVLIVAGTDVASLWSAARLQQYLSENSSRERLHLVLNRFRKIPGFTETEVQAASGLPVFWKIPNQYFAVSAAIDRGVPLMETDRSTMSRTFTDLAARLTETSTEVKRPTWSLFKIG
jgi:pilus assembly protein CpaE